MNTPLKSNSLPEEGLTSSEPELTAEELAEEETHIHLPGPSLWPILLGLAILLVFVGIIAIGTPAHSELSGVAPWFIFIGLPCVLIGIMGNTRPGGFRVKGAMQLFSRERNISHPIEGHAATFAELKIDDQASPTKLFVYAVRTANGAKVPYQ